MKKLFAWLFVLVLLSVTVFVPAAQAKGEAEPLMVSLAKTEVVNKDYFASGDSVTLSGTVNGDAYIAGGTVLIDGTINGDLLVAGGTVDIRGPVRQDIRAAGGSVTVSSSVGGNITVGAGSVAIHETARIGGSVLAGSGTLSILAPVGRGITAGAGTLLLNNSVGGDLLAGVGQLTLQPKTKIAGDATYWSEKEAMIADNVALSGELIFHQLPKSDTKSVRIAKDGFKRMAAAFIGVGLIATAVRLLATFVLGLVLMALLPVFTDKTVNMMKKNPWGSFGLGIVTVIILPILAVTAIATIIGIPIGVFFFMTTGLLCFVGHIFAAIFIGKGVFAGFKADAHRAWQLLMGLVILLVLTFIPILGWLAKGVFIMIGTGAILFEKHAVYRQMRAKRLV